MAVQSAPILWYPTLETNIPVSRFIIHPTAAPTQVKLATVLEIWTSWHLVLDSWLYHS